MVRFHFIDGSIPFYSIIRPLPGMVLGASQSLGGTSRATAPINLRGRSELDEDEGVLVLFLDP